MTAKQLLRQLAERGIRFVLHRNRVCAHSTERTYDNCCCIDP